MSLLWSLYISEMGMGQFVGYAVASPLVDKFGRRNCLLTTLFAQIPAQLCHILAQPLSIWPLLYLGRFATMILFAIQSVIVPVFLSEIAPSENRGSLGTTYPLSLSLGLCLVVAWA